MDGYERDGIARAYLQPVAAPSVLGLYAFATATFMAGAYFAGWYGGPTALQYIFPFAAAFGGITQLGATMWAFKARDVLATAMHGTWGSFWLGFGILNLLISAGLLTMPKPQFVPLGFWFIPLTVITFLAAIGATMGENLAMASVMHVLWAGASVLTFGFLYGAIIWQAIGGYVLVLASILATYAATALMYELLMGRTILPIGHTKRSSEKPKIDVGVGEPGVKQGQ